MGPVLKPLLASDRGKHVTPRNAMVVLIMPSVACDASTGIAWPKELCFTLFQASSPDKQNVAIDSDISAMCCLQRCQQHHMTKRVISQLCISCLYLIYQIMPLMLLFASHDSNSSIPNSTGMSQTRYLSAHLPSCSPLCTLLMSMWVSPKIQNLQLL